MGLETRRSVRIPVPGHGTIKISPQGGRKNMIEAPQSLEITDRKGRPISTMKRKRRLTPPNGAG